jgi:hypothetical protein
VLSRRGGVDPPRSLPFPHSPPPESNRRRGDSGRAGLISATRPRVPRGNHTRCR